MATVAQSVPPLAQGDKLTRDEFLRRWELHPEIKWAELIGGRVYIMSSPLSLDHGDTDFCASSWLGTYVLHTPGIRGSNNATVLMLEDAPQTDVHLRIVPEHGGQSSVEGKFLKGAPELGLEVSLSSAAYDLHEKLELYEEAGVKEYVVVLLYEREVRWHRLTDDGYVVHAPDADGIHRSVVFPGLWLDAKALLAGDMVRVQAVLNEGLQSREHAEFVARLAANGK
jgi:Uma2 family endonuclease